MKIARVRIKNFFNIKNADLDLSNDCALVVGPNGCGKTNIIKSVVKALNDAINGISTDIEEMLIDHKLMLLEGEDTCITLDFNLNNKEILTFLKLRIMFIVKKVFLLCEFHLKPMAMPSDLTKEFVREIIPQLFGILNSSIENLDERPRSGDGAGDVTCEYIGRPFHKGKMSFLGIKLPDDREKEKEVIFGYLKKTFGDDILERSLGLKRKPGNEEKIRVREVIDDILNHNEFYRLGGKHRCPSGDVSDVYCQATFNWPIELLSTRFDDVGRTATLNPTVVNFLRQGSICVLSQSHGYGQDEQDDLFWNLEKAEEKIVKAYLSKQGSEEYSALDKVKEAMLCIAGLELDVAYDTRPSHRHDKLIVFLREFNQPQAEWRYLSEVSGGQRELLMVLSTIHLSGADSVFLDEPGHSLHPPKQAQLRRWLETRRAPGQVLFIITHSADMISHNWVDALYHMHPDGNGYAASCLRGLPQMKPCEEAEKNRSANIVGSSSLSICNSSLSTPVVQQVSSGDEKVRNDENLNSDCTFDCKSSASCEDIESNEPPAKKKRFLAETRSHHEIEVSDEMIDFLMGVEMRRLFFSSGAVFVEGDTDRRIIEALRAVELEMANDTMNNRNSSLQEWHDALKETQMDSWDIIPINGSANWLKAYTAAKDLKIPFIVVLDADVLNKKSGSTIRPITYEDWNQCRLKVAIFKSGYTNDHPLMKMVKKVEELTNDRGNRGRRESLVRKEIVECNLWVWEEGDLEDLFFKNEELKKRLVKLEHFMGKLKELGVNPPRQSTSGRSQTPELSAGQNFQKQYAIFENLLGEVKEKFEKALEEVNKNPLNTDIVKNLANDGCLTHFAGQVKSKLNDHVRFVEKGTKKEYSDLEDESSRSRAELERFWHSVKKKLHDQGNWKSISFELLKEIVKVAINQQGHPLHALWEHIKNQMINSNTKARIPPNVIQEKVASMLD